MTDSPHLEGAVRKPPRRVPPHGGTEAKRLAAVVLDVLAGSRTPAEAAAALGASLPRYYVLEKRAMQGLLAACEPRPKGRQPDDARRVGELERVVARLQRECQRQQALARATQRAVGLAAPPPAKPAAKGKKARRRKPTVRALKAAAGLRADSSSPETADGVKPGTENG